MQRGWCAKQAEEIIIPSLKYVQVANRTHSQDIKRFGRSQSTKQIILQSCSVSYVCNLPCLSDQQVLSYILHIVVFILLRAGSLNTVALPRHVYGWNGSCTCQRLEHCNRICHLCKHSAFLWDEFPQLHSLEDMFGQLPSCSFPPLTWFSTDDKLKCLSLLPPWWLSFWQGQLFPALSPASWWVSGWTLLSQAGAWVLELRGASREKGHLLPRCLRVVWPAWGQFATLMLMSCTLAVPLPSLCRTVTYLWLTVFTSPEDCVLPGVSFSQLQGCPCSWVAAPIAPLSGCGPTH